MPCFDSSLASISNAHHAIKLCLSTKPELLETIETHVRLENLNRLYYVSKKDNSIANWNHLIRYRGAERLSGTVMYKLEAAVSVS